MTVKKVAVGILYSVLSVFWLYVSLVFTSAWWLDKPGTYDWEEDAMFIPIGFLMFGFWIISLVVLVFWLKKKKE